MQPFARGLSPKELSRFLAQTVKVWVSHSLCMTACVVNAAHTPESLMRPTAMPYAATRALPVESPPSVNPEIVSQTQDSVLLQSHLSAAQKNELIRLRSLAETENFTNLPKKPSSKNQVTTPAEAAWILGLLSLHGIGMPIDTDQAQRWFAQAAQQGLLLAHAGLAWCAIEACNGQAAPSLAPNSIAELRKINAPRALYLQWLLLTRQHPYFAVTEMGETTSSSPHHPDERPPLPYKTLLLQAADQGDVQARIELGIDSADRVQLKESLAHFNAVAKASTVAAQNAKIITDRIQRNDLLQTPKNTLASGSVAVSLINQARKNHRGDGVPANYTEALRLYRMAASAGSSEAEKMLQLIYSRLSPDGQIDLTWMHQLQDIDLSSAVPRPPKPQTPYWLRREPTALYDLLPPSWRSLR